MIDINEIMIQLGIGNKETVYMSISQTAGLEIIKVDTKSNTIVSYANRPLEYDAISYNIANYDAFKTAVQELYKELQIKPQCNVVLNLPTVLFARAEVPLILDNDSINEFLINNALDNNFIFNNNTPMIAWIDANTDSSNKARSLFYSAVQQEVVANIQDALTAIGSTLISVTTSICSTINALSFSDHVSKMVKDNMTWQLISLTDNGYSLCTMQGSNLIDYYNEEMAFILLEHDELYSALISSLQIQFMSNPSYLLYLVSSTNLLQVEKLSNMLKDAGFPTEYFENITSINEEIIPANLKISPSLEAIGTAVSNRPNLPLKIDLLKSKKSVSSEDDSPVEFKIGEEKYELSPQAAVKVSAVICTILIVFVFLFTMIFHMLSAKLQANLDQLNSESERIQNEIKTYKEKDSQNDLFNEEKEIETIVSDNRNKLILYSAIGETVPDDLWITYFYTRKDGKMDIKGAALSVEDISTFYKNLKDALINIRLRLYKLEMAANNIDDAVTNAKQTYTFEITNMSERELLSKNTSGIEQQETSSTNSEDTAPSSEPKNEDKNKQTVPNILPAGLK